MTDIRIKALAFAMALFLVSNILAADFANDFKEHFGDIFANKLANWQWYAALAISICFFFNLVLYMAGKALSLDRLEAAMRASLPADAPAPELLRAYGSSRDFRIGKVNVQLTEWPELGSLERGRIAPDGWLEPMFESIVANAGQY